MSKEKLQEEENVQLSKSEYAAMMSRLERLENPGIVRKMKRTNEHTGFLRLWESRLLTYLGSAEEDFNLPETSKKRLTIEVGLTDLEGKEKREVVNYLDFITHARKVRVKFLKMERNHRLEVDMEKGGGGYGSKRGVNADGSFTGGFGELGGVGLTGEEIELEVGFIDLLIEVEVLEGEFKGKKFLFTPETINCINA